MARAGRHGVQLGFVGGAAVWRGGSIVVTQFAAHTVPRLSAPESKGWHHTGGPTLALIAGRHGHAGGQPRATKGGEENFCGPQGVAWVRGGGLAVASSIEGRVHILSGPAPPRVWVPSHTNSGIYGPGSACSTRGGLVVVAQGAGGKAMRGPPHSGPLSCGRPEVRAGAPADGSSDCRHWFQVTLLGGGHVGAVGALPGGGVVALGTGAVFIIPAAMLMSAAMGGGRPTTPEVKTAGARRPMQPTSIAVGSGRLAVFTDLDEHAGCVAARLLDIHTGGV